VAFFFFFFLWGENATSVCLNNASFLIWVLDIVCWLTTSSLLIELHCILVCTVCSVYSIVTMFILSLTELCNKMLLGAGCSAGDRNQGLACASTHYAMPLALICFSWSFSFPCRLLSDPKLCQCFKPLPANAQLYQALYPGADQLCLPWSPSPTCACLGESLPLHGSDLLLCLPGFPLDKLFMGARLQ
jgi:hypothetical protein